MDSWKVLNVHRTACPECKEWEAGKIKFSRWKTISWPVGCVRFWQLFKAACKEDDGKTGQTKA